MRISSVPARPPAPPTPPSEGSPLAPEEVFDVTSRVSIVELVQSGRGVGNAMRKLWRHTENIVSKVLQIPVVDDNVSSGTERAIENGAEITAYSLGFAAAGIQGAAGLYKLFAEPEKRTTSRVIDGTYDLARAVATGASVADLDATTFLSPIATGIGGVRGAHRFVTGRHKGDARMQVDGLLQGTRSTSTLMKVLGKNVAPLGIASKVLVPVAGALQVGRGYHDLSGGLKANKNKKELWGFTDIVKGVGWTIACTGLAPLPGVGLTIAADVTRIAYQVSPRARKRMDKGIDKAEPVLKKILRQTDKVAGPVENRLRPLLDGKRS